MAVRVPSAIAREIGALEGGPADVTVESGRLIITPIVAARTYNLADLIAGITDENSHDEIATGAPVGKEYW